MPAAPSVGEAVIISTVQLKMTHGVWLVIMLILCVIPLRWRRQPCWRRRIKRDEERGGHWEGSGFCGRDSVLALVWRWRLNFFISTSLFQHESGVFLYFFHCQQIPCKNQNPQCVSLSLFVACWEIFKNSSQIHTVCSLNMLIDWFDLTPLVD